MIFELEAQAKTLSLMTMINNEMEKEQTETKRFKKLHKFFHRADELYKISRGINENQD